MTTLSILNRYIIDTVILAINIEDRYRSLHDSLSSMKAAVAKCGCVGRTGKDVNAWVAPLYSTPL